MLRNRGNPERTPVRAHSPVPWGTVQGQRRDTEGTLTGETWHGHGDVSNPCRRWQQAGQINTAVISF